MDQKKQLNGGKMNKSFKLRAAGFYLSDNCEEGLKILEEAVDSGKGSYAYGGVEFSIWEPFENSTMADLLSYIEDLAEHFERIYKEGEQACQNK